MTEIEKLVEECARALADVIADRHGQVAGGLNWMSEERRAEARAVIARTLEFAAGEALMIFADRNMRTIYGPLGEQTAMRIADRLRSLSPQEREK